MSFKVEELTTKGGAKGLIIHVPGANTMAYEFEFRAGDRYAVREKKLETAHIMEHLAFGANAKYKTMRKNNSVLQKNGASTNAYTSHISLVYYANCADFEWKRVFAHLLMQLESPQFLENEFKAEFGNVKEELALRWNYDTVRLFQLHNKNVGLTKTTFKDNLSLMDNVVHADIIEHYKRTHTQKNMRFIIAGKISASRKKTILSLMDSFQLQIGNKRLDIIKGGQPSKKPLLFIKKDNASALSIEAEMFLKTPITKEENLAMKILNNIITGTLHSRIFGKAREKGWVYDMGSSCSNWREYPGFEFFIQVSDRNAVNVMRLIVSELKKISNGGLKNSELKAAKQFALGSFQKSLQTPNNYISYFSDEFYEEDQIRDYKNYKNKINSITKSNIINILNKFINNNSQAVSILGLPVHENVAKKVEKEYLKLWVK
jgi:predicted Zn-dependent peptidase